MRRTRQNVGNTAIRSCSMVGIRSIVNRSWTPTLVRGFWASMGIVHASALISASTSFINGGPDASGLAGCLALTLSVVYFGLKVCGVSILRFRPGKRAWVVAGLLCVLIHADCIRPGFNDLLASGYPDLLATAAFVGGVCQIPGIRCLSRRRCDPSSRAGESAGWSIRAIDLTGFLPHCWVLAARLFRLRAPPV